MQLIVFLKSYFKLMIDSIYGKTMEHLSKRINIKLMNNAKDYVNYIIKPSFVSQKIFSKNFVNQSMLDLVFWT